MLVKSLGSLSYLVPLLHSCFRSLLVIVAFISLQWYAQRYSSFFFNRHIHQNLTQTHQSLKFWNYLTLILKSCCYHRGWDMIVAQWFKSGSQREHLADFVQNSQTWSTECALTEPILTASVHIVFIFLVWYSWYAALRVAYPSMNLYSLLTFYQELLGGDNA